MGPNEQLLAAIAQSNFSGANLALAAGANASARKSVALANAIQKEDADIIALLLQHGASIPDAQALLSMSMDHDVPLNFRDTDMAYHSHVGMAIACMKAGMWPIEEIAKHCNTTGRLALVMRHHPDAVSLVPLLSKTSRAFAVDMLVELS